MCGITGFIDLAGESSMNVLKAMVATLHHRGPDDRGTELLQSTNATVGLGHARLSIIDLSASGHQPMKFENLSMVYNGEVYNYIEVRDELEDYGYSFDGHSDSEVILKAFHKWGRGCVDRFIGMFAIAIFDADKHELTLIRDRAGVKPLYLYQTDDIIIFGSELKSLIVHPRFATEIDYKVIPEYLNYGYVPGPLCIFKDTEKVQPGCMVIFNAQSRKRVDKQYWDITKYYQKPKFKGTYEEAKKKLKGLLQSAYNYRMVSDVPAGVFLSGGYDSTSVAAILSKDREEKLNTFTIGFHEGNNEAPQAKKISEILGTNHTEFYCTDEEAKNVILKLPEIYDEPFADSSAIPTTLVSEMAKQKVTVALSADGGDEQFFGYGHYFTQHTNLKKIQNPWYKVLSTPTLNQIAKTTANLAPFSTEKKYQINVALEAIVKKSGEDKAYTLFSSSLCKPKDYINQFLLNPVEPEIESDFNEEIASFHQSEDVFSWLDYKQYLPDDILTKVDRATMSVSIEGREPLLDHRIAEFAASLPLEFKYEGENSGKKILKDIVHEYVPKEIMDQPKRGFTIPVLKWLKGDLKWLLDKYLSEEALMKTKTFQVDFVRKELKAFLNDEMHYKPLIWYILMYQMWYFKWILNIEL